MPDAKNPGQQHPATMVSLPGSLADIAKALRELIGVFTDVAPLVDRGLRYTARKKSRSAAGRIDNLRFRPDGFRRPLRAIASGSFTHSQISELRTQLFDTEKVVGESIAALEKYRTTIRETYGMAMADKLDDLLIGFTGKDYIRYLIRELISDADSNIDDRDSLSRQASYLLGLIDDLNTGLAELHDMVVVQRVDAK
jgi:hypothetical protein